MIKPTEINLEDILKCLEEVPHIPDAKVLVRFEIATPKKFTFEVQDDVDYRHYPGKGVVFVFDIGPVESYDPNKPKTLRLFVDYTGSDNKQHSFHYAYIKNCAAKDVEDLKKRLKKDVWNCPNDNVVLAVKYS